MGPALRLIPALILSCYSTSYSLLSWSYIIIYVMSQIGDLYERNIINDHRLRKLLALIAGIAAVQAGNGCDVVWSDTLLTTGQLQSM